MADEKWQRVREVFDSALRQKPDERRRFVHEACGEDEILFAEVESLLSSLDSAESFMERPAVAEVADVIEIETRKLEAGKCFGHYQIIEQIGAGGMGEVYLAEDTRLERKTALKILPGNVAHDEERMQRFVREAKSASALNHPNIITIYEIGETDNTHFIATEYIKGDTLRERLKSARINLKSALEIAIQVASALDAAHRTGIVHRDIKPENVMIRADGLVKILDFGIAKLTEKLSETVLKAATEAQTRAGMIIGTAAYMSPEQARGQTVDARSDIFSFGVMLYEMLAGKRPFEGENAIETIGSILNKEPVPLSRQTPEVPHEIERIINKTLRKDREERYQTAKDTLIDLKDVKQDLEFQKKLERTAAPDREEAKTHVFNATTSDISPHTTSSAEYIVNSIKHHKRSAFRGLVALIIGTIALLFFFFNQTSIAPQAEIKSLAVLPLKSLDAGENYLGLGIADAVIRRINQTGKLVVRPTSAVRRYLNEDTDALTAARQLDADAVLEGSVQRVDDRLRVSVNLLRTSDGASLWADSFDMRMTDIFTIQDTMAQQVASRLRLQLNPEQQARLNKRSTSNPIAYEYYLKGVYSFDQRGWGDRAKPQMEATIELYKKAIEADPNYALAHAQLAYAYVWKALFIEQESMWVERAKEEINRAQTLDPQLPETHVARYLLLWSRYEGFQNEAAARELRLAQQLNPNIGHVQLGDVYHHLGLEDLAAREYQRALDIDPTSEYVKTAIQNSYWGVNKYDEWLAACQKFSPECRPTTWYFMGKGRLDEAQKIIEEIAAKDPTDPALPRSKALLFALKRDFRAAEAEIPLILSKQTTKDFTYHHATYYIACVYALAGKSDEAVKWLRETAATGFPCYPLFERDPYLNRIRRAPEFIQFMAEMKAQNERYRREFA